MALIQESLPHRWFRRNSDSRARLLVLFVWMMLSTVLGLAYESNLLSLLATKR